MSPDDLIDDFTYYLNVSVRSSNYFVRPRQHIRRDRHADMFCGFEIDYELELGRLLNREFGESKVLNTVVFLLHDHIPRHRRSSRSKVSRLAFGIEPSFLSIMDRLIVLNIAVATEGKSNPASFQLAIK